MNLKALDSFYTDETRMIADGQVFSVDSDELAKDLIKRGVARAAQDGEESGKEKARPVAPKNKDGGPSPSNKGKGKGKDTVLRDDGPTIEEYVAAGYLAANYPPQGYASRSTPEEIAAAVEAAKTV